MKLWIRLIAMICCIAALIVATSSCDSKSDDEALESLIAASIIVSTRLNSVVLTFV